MIKIKKAKELTIPSVAKDVEELEFSTISLVGMRVTITLENSWWFLKKFNVPATIRSSHSSPRYAKRKESPCPQKGLYTNVHSHFTVIAKHWKQAKSIKRGMVKKNCGISKQWNTIQKE